MGEGVRRHDTPNLIRGQRGTGLFVHVPRTGGQSLAMVLAVSRDTHLTALELRSRVTEDLWNDSLRFAVVRNPWDHYVSWYLYTHGLGDADDHAGEIRRFRVWVRNGCPRESHQWENRQPVDPLDQLKFLCDADGELLVRVVCFHRLRDAYGWLVSRLGLPYRVLPHRSKSTRLRYQDYYDDHCQKIVAEQRDAEVRRFRFSF